MGVVVLIVKHPPLLYENPSDLTQAEMFTDGVMFKSFIHATFSRVLRHFNADMLHIKEISIYNFKIIKGLL